MSRSRIWDLDPEFEAFCNNLKKDMNRTLGILLPKKKIIIKNTQIQKIIVNMNNKGINIKLKKISGKRNRFRLIFDENKI